MSSLIGGSTSKKTYETYDQSASAAQDAVALSGGSRYTTISTDGGAVEKAINLTSEALAANTYLNENMFKESLGFGVDSMNSSYGFSNDIARRSFDFGNWAMKDISNSTENALDVVSENVDTGWSFVRDVLGIMTNSNTDAAKQMQASNTNAVKASQQALESVANYKQPDAALSKQIIYGVVGLGGLFIVYKMITNKKGN